MQEANVAEVVRKEEKAKKESPASRDLLEDYQRHPGKYHYLGSLAGYLDYPPGLEPTHNNCGYKFPRAVHVHFNEEDFVTRRRSGILRYFPF